MRTSHYILPLTLLFAVPAEAKAEAWSLDSCINYALTHNLDVKSALIERTRGDLNVAEASDRFLPTLSAGASQSWSYGRGLTSENTYANRNTSSLGWNVSLSLPLFQGLSALRQLEQTRANLNSLDMQVQAARDEVTLSVMSLYLQALYSKELLEVRREELRLSATQLSHQESLFEAGKVPEVDVLQAKSQVASSQVAVVNAEGDYNLAIVDLTRALELDETTLASGFDVLPLENDGIPLIPSADDVYCSALSSNSTILAARSAINVADKALSTAKTGYIPRLSFNAGIGSSYYTLSGAPTESFGRQMRDNLSKSLGLSLSIPIFDAFSTRNQVRQARLQRLSAELELERRESNLLRTIHQAETQARAAEAQYTAGETAVSASRAALEAMTDKYNLGRANATEWEQSRSNYITTLAQQVQAKYQMILRTRILEFYNQ